MLLGQSDAFVVDQRGVFDRGHAGANRILDAFGRMGVRFHPQAEVTGFVDGGVKFFGSELRELGLLPCVSTAPLERTLMWSAPSCAS